MRNIWIAFATIGLVLSGIFFESCDKIENPVVPPIELDTNLYPGNWSDYPWPTFGANPNTNINVLLEDYTGHRCPGCPAAATEAKNIETANPNRVVVLSVHAAPGDGFQYVSTPGDGTYPKYSTDFTTDQGDQYVVDISGFIGNPCATINRESQNGASPFNLSIATWGNIVSDIINTNDLKVNLQQELNYYNSTNGLFVHVQAEAMEQISANVSIVTCIVEKDIVATQKDGANDILDYHHHNVFRGTLTGAYGEQIFSSANTGEKFQVDLSYEIPSSYLDSNLMIVTYAMDINTFKVYHVIWNDLIP